ncbi:MAG TPA: DUF1707 domain-containing protein [Solirubrobacteraceae bacterium]|nr:DUF1707 domain-containing protein [Solirubrobacteraceae bacterium]
MTAPEPPEDHRPQLRVSDEDRERTVLALRDGAAEGRLTFDELAGRAELAYTAVSREELDRLVDDLPAASASASPDRPDRKRRRWNIAVMGGSERRGRWRPAPDLVAVAVMGGVELDLRDALIEDEDIVITAVAVMGGIEIIVPEGIEVDVGGFAFMGGHEYRPGSEPIRPGTPVVRVRGYALMGGLEVRVKRSGAAK